MIGALGCGVPTVLFAGCAKPSSRETQTSSSVGSGVSPATPTGVEASLQYDERSPAIESTNHRLSNPGITTWDVDVDSGIAYLATRSGNPVRAAAYDLEESRVVENYTIAEGESFRSVAATEDYVYFGMRAKAHVHQLERATGEVRHLAQIDGAVVNGIAVAPDGAVYAGGQESRVYEIDPEDGQVESLGRMAPTEHYAYDLVAMEESVYVGVGNTENAGLYEIDRETGTVTQHAADVFDEFGVKVEQNGRYLCCHGTGETTLLVDLTSKNADGQFESYRIVDPLPGEFALDDRTPNLIYYPVLPGQTENLGGEWETDTAGMFTYDVETEERTRRFDLPSAVDERGINYRSSTIVDGTFVAVQSPKSGTFLAFDIDSGAGDVVDLQAAGMEPTAILNQEVGTFRGRPVTGINGTVFVYDLPGESLTELDIEGEPKRMTTVGEDLYVATYTGATFWRYDGESLHSLGSAEGQVRPLDLIHAESEDAVVQGTQPGYGKQTGGAVSVLDLESESVETYKNVVPDQSISSLAETSNGLYLGTHIRRGQGTQPVTEEGRIGHFDRSSGETTWTTVPATGHRSIPTLGSHGSQLFGIAFESWSSGGTFFVVDTESNTVTQRESIPFTGHLQAGPDDRFYAVAASPRPPSPRYEGSTGGLIVYDPETRALTRVYDDRKRFAFLGESAVVEDAIYYVDSKDWRLRSIDGLGQY
jgi:outer membrane protein assembly factor BamB